MDTRVPNLACLAPPCRQDPAEADGGKVKAATVSGKARNILMGERIALNVLCRSSGIATKSVPPPPAVLLGVVRA